MFKTGVVLRATLCLIVFSGCLEPYGWTQSDPKNGPSTTEVVSLTTLESRPRKFFKDLAQRGISFQGLFVQDWSWEPDEDASAYGFARYSLDLTLTIDGEKSVGWRGATGALRLKQHLNEFGKGDESAEQLYSNIDGPSRTMLYELWLDQKLGDKVRGKIGKMDSTTDFAVVEGAADFLNSSMGYSPTILNFPTYPDPRPGAAIFLGPFKNYSLKTGVFQSLGSGTFSIMEPSRTWSTKNDLPGRLSVGYWRRDGSVPRFDGSSVSSTQGAYSVLEQSLWHHTLTGHDGERVVSSFLQLGSGDSHVNAMTTHVGGGSCFASSIRH